MVAGWLVGWLGGWMGAEEEVSCGGHTRGFFKKKKGGTRTLYLPHATPGLKR